MSLPHLHRSVVGRSGPKACPPAHCSSCLSVPARQVSRTCPQAGPVFTAAPQAISAACTQRRNVSVGAASLERAYTSPSNTASSSKPLKVLIAGAGISGLALALALIKKGFEVQVFERDLTAIRGEGKYRGPIQVGGIVESLPRAEVLCGISALVLFILFFLSRCPRCGTRGSFVAFHRSHSAKRYPLQLSLMGELSRVARCKAMRWLPWRPSTKVWPMSLCARGASRATASTACATGSPETGKHATRIACWPE